MKNQSQMVKGYSKRLLCGCQKTLQLGLYCSHSVFCTTYSRGH